ncbi:MAG: hypothetical protein WCA32_10000 [Chromatiaceae bacterium]
MKENSRAVGALLPLLSGVIERGNGRYSALCPAHDDKAPSLSVSAGADGRTLIHCHAGCTPDAILTALGLRWTDLYPDRWVAAWASACARPATSPTPDPLEVERMVLRIAAADLRGGKKLTLEDRARLGVARQRLAESRRRAA